MELRRYLHVSIRLKKREVERRKCFTLSMDCCPSRWCPPAMMERRSSQ